MTESPRIVFLGNNHLAVRVASWMRQHGSQIVGAVLHPPSRARYRTELEQVLDLPPEAIFDGSCVNDEPVIRELRMLDAEIAVSVLFGFILKPPALAAFRRGVVNLHPSLLPLNRGASPNIWSIVDQTPAGATIHYVDEGIDTGDVIVQSEVSVDLTDTGLTLYRKLEDASYELFTANWDAIVQGILPRRPQAGAGTVHRVKDRDAIAEIDLDGVYTARNLIDVMRALTFPPYDGAFFRDGERKISMRLELTARSDEEEGGNEG